MTKKKRINTVVWVVIGLPVVSVLMGIVTLTFALRSGENEIQLDEAPLSKTSWRESS